MQSRQCITTRHRPELQAREDLPQNQPCLHGLNCNFCSSIWLSRTTLPFSENFLRRRHRKTSIKRCNCLHSGCISITSQKRHNYVAFRPPQALQVSPVQYNGARIHRNNRISCSRLHATFCSKIPDSTLSVYHRQRTSPPQHLTIPPLKGYGCLSRLLFYRVNVTASIYYFHSLSLS